MTLRLNGGTKMALVNCHECGNQISNKAAACPHCGAPVNEQETVPEAPTAGKPTKEKDINIVGTVIVAFLFFIVIGWIVSNWEENVQEAANDYLQPNSQSAPEPVDPRHQKIKSQFSAWDGTHIKLNRQLKAALRDPDSYQHIKTAYRDRGESILVTTDYRAKNGFGGYDVGRVFAEYSIEGDLLSGPFNCDDVPDSVLCKSK